MNELIDGWRKIELDEAPFKLKADSVQGFNYKSYAEFIEGDNFGKSSFEFHLGLIPQPYIGNLTNAKVIILMLNPGFSPGDYYAQEHCASFKQARITNLRQENTEEDYPFFYLNPEFAWTAGGQWWQGKLRSVTNELVAQQQLTFREALQHISKHVACIELCPYFSKEYKHLKTPLPSMELVLEYVQSEVKNRCQTGEAIAVVTRQQNAWKLGGIENILCLEAGQARGAHLTMNTEAGKRIYQKLITLL